MGRGKSKGSGSARSQVASPLLNGAPQSIRTIYKKSFMGGGTYNDEVLDATFNTSTGELTFDWASDKTWDNSHPTNKHIGVDINVQNGMINGRPVNLDLSNSTIKSIDAPNIGSSAEKTLRSNGFDYSSFDKKWIKGYQGFKEQGTTLYLDSKIPNDLSKFKEIKGNTYPNRVAIKKAGFKWDSSSQSWKKP